MKTSFNFSESPIYVDANDLDPTMYEDWKACGGSGDQSENVDAFIRQYDITGDEAVCREALKPEGAWTEDQLQDHDENLRRVVWIFGSMFTEDETLTMLGE